LPARKDNFLKGYYKLSNRRIGAKRWLNNYNVAQRLPAPVQPPPELASKISAVYSGSEKEAVPASTIPGLKKIDAVMVDGVPHFPYWQGNQDEYIFHPLSYGKLLAKLGCGPQQSSYLSALATTAYELEDGGLLWFYPKAFNLSRFLSPHFLPSAIGQGQLLSGIVQYAQRCGTDLKKLARKIFKGLAFPYCSGGLNLAGSALLEIPLYKSAPEIVLNGWIHALLSLKSYVDYSNDKQALALLRSNYAFLAKTISDFHDQKTGLSLYSNLVPYQLRLEPGLKKLQVLYLPLKKYARTLHPLLFDLRADSYSGGSPYDNHVVKSNKAYTIAWVSCSKMYSTHVVSEGGPFTASLWTGEYSPTRATPSRGGERLTLTSRKIGPFHVIDLDDARSKLYCGFPTNFSKLGRENYYHTYHIVSLACLLATSKNEDINQSSKNAIIRQTKNWIYTLADLSRKGFSFASYEDMLDDLWTQGVCPLDVTWNKLAALAGLG